MTEEHDYYCPYVKISIGNHTLPYYSFPENHRHDVTEVRDNEFAERAVVMGHA